MIKDITIHKFRGQKNFTLISNQLLRNDRLSYQARGLMAYILSLPDSWEIYVSFLATQAKCSKGFIQKTVKELAALGYMHLEVVRDAKTGRVVGRKWVAFDNPEDNMHNPLLTNSNHRQPLLPIIGENRSSVLPSDGGMVTIKKDSEERKDSVENKHQPAEPLAPPTVNDVPFELSPIPKPEEPTPKLKQEEMTALKNTLAEIEGLNIAETTAPAWLRISKALKIIRSVAPNVTPDELRRRAVINKRSNPWRSNLTAMTLASEWGKSGVESPDQTTAPAKKGTGYGPKGLAPIR